MIIKMNIHMRVREALQDSYLRNALRYKLPKEVLHMPIEAEELKTASPSAILKDIDCSELGWVTEYLLREVPAPLYTQQDVLRIQAELFNNKQIQPKSLKSVTTIRYLESVLDTQKQLHDMFRGEVPLYDVELSISGCSIVGHPDIISESHVFEVKTTRRMKSDWKEYIYQVFCYAALRPQARYIHLVFPLQNYIWTYDTTKWTKRAAFTEILCKYNQKEELLQTEDTIPVDIFFPTLMALYPIGYHIHKQKSLPNTLKEYPEPMRPLQIMFTRAAKMQPLSDKDIMSSYAIIQERQMKVYVHSPYLLNLCIEPYTQDGYVAESLREHLRYTSAFGGKGVVVHVGKACKRSMEEAYANMHTNIIECLDAATPECPLLLETPAGQGSETLTKLEDFMNFVESFQDPRIRVCIDTCHVFACGVSPDIYLQTVFANPAWAPLVKLIHLNDSHGDCCSCVDRHAPLGRGKIPQKVLVECIQLAHLRGIPMVME